MPVTQHCELAGFRPPGPLQERICAFGGQGTGKTRNVLDVIKMARVTGSDSQLYVIESDLGSMNRMLYSSTTAFASIRDRVHVYPVEEWPEWTAALDEIRGLARPQDWLLVDLITDAWQVVQDYYLEQVGRAPGDDPAAYFLKRKVAADKARTKALKEGGKVKGDDTGFDGKDWEVIKKLYGQFFNRLYGRMQCHVYVTAMQREVRGDYHPDDLDTRRLYGPLGVLPKGEKQLPHKFDTVVHCGVHPGEGKWYLTTIKDRERSLIDEVENKGFARPTEG
jgi:hypothetical protein